MHSLSDVFMNEEVALMFLKSRNYVGFLEYVKSLKDNNKVNYNYYLYLLSFIIILPDELKIYAQNIRLDDIFDNTEESEYEIRRMVYKQQFKQACNLCNMNELEKYLLNIVYTIQIDYKNEIEQLVITENYSELISKYNSLRKQFAKMSRSDKCIYFLTECIIQVQYLGVKPRFGINKHNSIFSLIMSGRFYQAKVLIEKTKSSAYLKDNLIYTLICTLIKELEKIKNDNTDTFCVKEEEKELISKNTNKTLDNSDASIKVLSTEDCYVSIIKCLLSGNQDILQYVDEYLVRIDKVQYKFLITGLIKLSYLENDITFSKPMSTLLYLAHDSYKFDLSECVVAFYSNLVSHKFEEAKVYLEILSGAKNIGSRCILINELEAIYDNTVKMVTQNDDTEIYQNMLPKK